MCEMCRWGLRRRGRVGGSGRGWWACKVIVVGGVCVEGVVGGREDEGGGGGWQG